MKTKEKPRRCNDCDEKPIVEYMFKKNVVMCPSCRAMTEGDDIEQVIEDWNDEHAQPF